MGGLGDLLSTPMLASILMIVSLGWAAYSFVQFMPQKGELQPKLQKIEIEVEKFRKRAKPRREGLKKLSDQVGKMKKMEVDMQEYEAELSLFIKEAEKTESEDGKIGVHDITDR